MLRSKRGSLLIVVVWLLVFFSILGLSLVKILDAHFAGVKRLEEYCISRNLAFSAAQKGVFLLNEMIANGKVDGDDLVFFQDRSDDNFFLCRIKDEQSRLPLNKCGYDILNNVPELDSDTAMMISSSEYRPFELMEQLVIMSLIDQDRFSFINKYFTVYGDGRLNINTAQRETLVLSGMDASLIDKLLRYRDGQDLLPGTGDENFFESISSCISDIKERENITIQERLSFNELLRKGLLSVSSECLVLEVSTFVHNNKSWDYKIYINKKGILKWQKGVDLYSEAK